MSDAPTLNNQEAPPPPPDEHAEADSLGQPQKTMTSRVWREVLRSWGAIAGLVWVALMVFGAVFAPFIANTHPYAMKKGGEWSFPLFAHLSVGDILLLIATGLTVLVVAWPRLRLGARALVWAASFSIITLLLLWPTGLKSFVVEGHTVWTGSYSEWQQYDASQAPEVISSGGTVTFAEVPELPTGSIAWWVTRWLLLLGWVIVSLGLAAMVALKPMVPMALKITALILTLAIGGIFMFNPINPPEATIYESYRNATDIESAWYAPVPYSPDDRLRDQPELRLTEPTYEHLMGVTNYGSDLFANMLYATRIALTIGFISTGIAIAIGIFIGGLMGYFSGIFDLLGMRLVEIFSAVPTLFLLLAFVAAIPLEWKPYMLYAIMVIIGLTGWVGYAVFIRAEFLKLRKQEFVLAAQALGLPLWSILFRHMLPNGVAPVLVSASFGVAGAILAESTLSFLGIGLVAEASWGKLLNQALGVGGTFHWWIAFYPGLAIFLTVFAYNLVGEALRDAIDPKLQGKG